MPFYYQQSRNVTEDRKKTLGYKNVIEDKMNGQSFLIAAEVLEVW